MRPISAASFDDFGADQPGVLIRPGGTIDPPRVGELVKPKKSDGDGCSGAPPLYCSKGQCRPGSQLVDTLW
jgi:hypothetical protein